MGGIIKSRQVLLLAVGMFIFTLGFGIIVPVMPYYAKNLGATAFDLGLLMATFSIMQFIFAPAWGVISDRVGRKPIMMIGLLGFGLSFTLTGLSSQPIMLSISELIGRYTGLTPHIGVLFCSELIGGTLSAGIWPAILAYIADITKPEERGSLMGLMGAASGLGIIFGPAISGFIAVWGLTLPYFAGAALAYVTAIMSYAMLRESRIKGTETKAEKKVPMMHALRTTFGIIFLLSLFISFAGAFIDGTFAYFVMDRFGLTDLPSKMPFLNGTIVTTGPGVMGIVFTAMGIIGVLCQGLLVGKCMALFGEERTIMGGLVICGAGILLLLAAGGLLTLIFFICLIGIGSGLVFPSLNTLVSMKTDPESQGAMLGALGSFSSFGRAIGPPVGSFLYMINTALPYVASAIVSVLSAMILYVKGRSDRQADKINITIEPPIKV